MVSETAALIIVGIIPIDLLAKEKRHTYQDKVQGDTTTKRDIRERTM